jgi:hypothetical protein
MARWAVDNREEKGRLTAADAMVHRYAAVTNSRTQGQRRAHSNALRGARGSTLRQAEGVARPPREDRNVQRPALLVLRRHAVLDAASLE